MLKTRFVLFVALSLSLLLVLSGCGGKSQPQQGENTKSTVLSMGSSPVGTAGYQAAVALSDVINKKASGITVNVEETKGWIENVRLLSQGEMDLGIVNGRVANDGYLARENFKELKPKQYYAIIAQQPVQAHFYVTKESGINTVNDIKGKKIAIAQPGGTANWDAKTYIEALGLKLTDMKIYEVDIQEQIEMIKNGQLDGGVWSGIVPTPALVDLFLTKEMKILPVPAEVAKKVNELNSAYASGIIPKGSYKGQDTDIPTVQPMSMWVAKKDVSEDVVYRITKAIAENLKDLGEMQPSFKRMNKDMFLEGIPIPLHPGALKYYKEINLPGIDEFVKKTEALK